MTEPTTATFRAYDHLSGGVAAHPEEADGLREMLQKLESQLAAVRALHRHGPTKARYPGGPLYRFCEHCDARWTCPTIRALDGVQAQGEEQ